MQLLVMRSPSVSCYLVSLRPKYLPQHPILERPQPLLFPQFERPSLTCLQKNRQNYSSACFHSL
jgi:hypothetical protein